jgi:hypothetical protein
MDNIHFSLVGVEHPGGHIYTKPERFGQAFGVGALWTAKQHDARAVVTRLSAGIIASS